MLTLKSTLKIFLLTVFSLLSNELSSQYVNDLKVNDEIPGVAHQLNSSIGANESGCFVVVWENWGSVATGHPRLIYFQIFNKNGVRVGSNVRVNLNDTISARPHVTMRKDSSFAVTWYNGNYILKIFDKLGNPLTGDIIINDSTVFSAKHINVDSDNNGNIYCAFYLTTDFNMPRNIYYQKFDAAGNKIGPNKKINDDTNNSLKEPPVITIRQDGSFIVAWDDKRLMGGGSSDIFMQMYDANGNKIGVNTLVNDKINFRDHSYASISSDTAGYFNIVWSDNRLLESYYQPFCQAFDPAGVKIGGNFRVDQGITFDKTHPKISKRKDGKYVVGWINSDGSGTLSLPLFRRFNNNNTAIAGNDTVSKPYKPIEKTFYDIKLVDDRIITTWRDQRNEPENGDIYLNIRSFQNPDSIITHVVSVGSQIPEDFNLEQNYPNPFNPNTSIKFNIPTAGLVTLSIYNSVGQKISEPVNKILTPGTYLYNWNAAHLSSGIYFYTLRAGSYTNSKTALLLK